MNTQGPTMNITKHTLWLAQILGIGVLGFVFGSQLWDNIPALFGLLYPALTWPFMLFFGGWCVAVIWLLVRLPQHPKSTALIFIFWIFTSVGAVFTFAQGLDYMKLSDIIFWSVYLASGYSFLLLVLGWMVLNLKRKIDARASSAPPQ